MPFGIDTHQARLSDEIDWITFSALSGADPSFAGRHFLSGRWKRPDPASEAIDTVYTWVHGESLLKPPASLQFIAPIQSGLAYRQTLTGDDGWLAGTQDGKEVCERLARSFSMREFSFPRSNVRIFLEVEDGVRLSPDYWAGWATRVFTHLVPWENANYQPFLPCIMCKFVEQDGVHVPEDAVAECLNTIREVRDGVNRCRGFWARTTMRLDPVAPPPATIDLVKLPVFKQKISEQYRPPVPVFVCQFTYTRPADPLTPAMDPRLNRNVATAEVPLEDWMLQLTPIRVHADGVDQNRFGFLRWDNNVAACGIDFSRGLADVAADNTTTITALLDKIKRSRMVRPVSPVLDGSPVSFVGRYYGYRRAVYLQDWEAKSWSRRGINMISLYQTPERIGAGGRLCKNEWKYFGLAYFDQGFAFGRLDGLDACQKAEKAGQPPRTPIYFSVDIIPEQAFVAAPADYAEYRTASAAQIESRYRNMEAYFRGVAQAFIEHQADAAHKKTPYEIGVYGRDGVVNRILATGIASHYWGIGRGGGPEGASWPHPPAYIGCANGYQTDLNIPDDMVALQIPAAGGVGPPETIKLNLDFNVTWGDAGWWRLPPEEEL